jgi:hypothetical protein
VILPPAHLRIFVLLLYSFRSHIKSCAYSIWNEKCVSKYHLRFFFVSDGCTCRLVQHP